MSYELYLRFRRPLPADRLARYLTSRGHFSATAEGFVYSNPDTGVYFTLQPRGSRLPFLGQRVSGLHFEINYGRPSYFVREADIELRALIAAFDPKIEDPQMHGMGAGAYTSEGFLRGWTFGNEYFVSERLKDGAIHRHHRLPSPLMSDVWEWNYRRSERARILANTQFLPLINFVAVEDRPCLSTIWGEGMPTLLPKVDHVFVGRFVDGERRFGLASWAEVLEVVSDAGVSTEETPLDINYQTTPDSIARWLAELPLIDLASIPVIEPERLLDEEAVGGGQRFLDGNAGGSSGILPSV